MRACLVLHTDKAANNGLPDFFRLLFSDSPTFTGSMFSDRFNVGLATEIQNDVGTFAVSDNAFFEMPVPSRSSLIVTCFDGTLIEKKSIDEFTGITDDKYAENGFFPSKLMVRLNSTMHKDGLSNDDSSNYADRVKQRVVDKLLGTFSFTMAYITLSGRSRIIVARKQRDIYFHFVYNNGFYCLVWTDEVDVFNMIDNRFFIYSMTPLYSKEVLVIHPLYLIDKWKKWKQRYKSSGGHLMAVSVLEKYLGRISR